MSSSVDPAGREKTRPVEAGIRVGAGVRDITRSVRDAVQSRFGIFADARLGDGQSEGFRDCFEVFFAHFGFCFQSRGLFRRP